MSDFVIPMREDVGAYRLRNDAFLAELDIAVTQSTTEHQACMHAACGIHNVSTAVLGTVILCAGMSPRNNHFDLTSCRVKADSVHSTGAVSSCKVSSLPVALSMHHHQPRLLHCIGRPTPYLLSRVNKAPNIIISCPSHCQHAWSAGGNRAAAGYAYVGGVCRVRAAGACGWRAGRHLAAAVSADATGAVCGGRLRCQRLWYSEPVTVHSPGSFCTQLGHVRLRRLTWNEGCTPHGRSSFCCCSECCAQWPTPLRTAACNKFLRGTPPQGLFITKLDMRVRGGYSGQNAVCHLAQQPVLMLRVLCAVALSASNGCGRIQV